MWRVYNRTRNDEGYIQYREAINAATNEIWEHKANISM